MRVLSRYGARPLYVPVPEITGFRWITQSEPGEERVKGVPFTTNAFYQGVAVVVNRVEAENKTLGRERTFIDEFGLFD